jgi:hypothetical protein
MTSHQQLRQYNGGLYGTPSYGGLEYDFEVPDNMIVSSPGGVSAIQHHYTKGMYSDASSTWDVYAGDGDRYPYGPLGNLYQVGQSSAQQNHQYGPAPDMMYTQNQSSAHRDNFTATDVGNSIELLPPSDTEDVTPVSTTDKKKIVLLNPVVIFLIFAVVYMALDLWIRAGESFLASYFHKGRELSYKWLFFYAALFTVIVFVIISTINIPLIGIERL